MKHILLSFLYLFSFQLLLSQPGTLVSTFGEDGIVFRSVSDGYDDAGSITIAEDGSIFDAGINISEGLWNSLVSKYSETGTVVWDTIFDASGQELDNNVFTAVASSNSLFIGINYDDDSFGDERKSVKVTKWNLDGSKDSAFGDNGEVIVSRSDLDLRMVDMQVDAMNRIYLIGNNQQRVIEDVQYTIVIRLNSDGTLDESYGVGGYYLKNWGADFNSIVDAVVLENEVFLLARNFPSSASIIVFNKIDETGNVDNEFGTNGRVIIPNGVEDFSAITSQGSNHLLVTGVFGENRDAIIYRYDLQGTVDQTFGQDGKTILDFGEREIQRDIIVDSDNGIYVGGYVNSPADFYLFHMDENGGLNTDFGNDGFAIFDVNDDDYLNEIALAADGHLILGGLNESASPNTIILMKVEGVNGCFNSSAEVSIVGCDQVTFQDQIISTSGSYQFISPNSKGCDSIVTLTATIFESPTVQIELLDGSLQSSNDAASFQWLDCENNIEIEGATSNSYTPTASGSYALEVTENQCASISECQEVIISSIENTKKLAVKIYPNPISNYLIIENPENLTFTSIQILNSQGVLLRTILPDHSSGKLAIELSNLSKGMFFLEVSTKDARVAHYPFVKY